MPISSYAAAAEARKKCSIKLNDEIICYLCNVSHLWWWEWISPYQLLLRRHKTLPYCRGARKIHYLPQSARGDVRKCWIHPQKNVCGVKKYFHCYSPCVLFLFHSYFPPVHCNNRAHRENIEWQAFGSVVDSLACLNYKWKNIINCNLSQFYLSYMPLLLPSNHQQSSSHHN